MPVVRPLARTSPLLPLLTSWPVCPRWPVWPVWPLPTARSVTRSRAPP